MSKHRVMEDWRAERAVRVMVKNGEGKRGIRLMPRVSVECYECGGETQNEDGICSFCLLERS